MKFFASRAFLKNAHLPAAEAEVFDVPADSKLWISNSSAEEMVVIIGVALLPGESITSYWDMAFQGDNLPAWDGSEASIPQETLDTST